MTVIYGQSSKQFATKLAEWYPTVNHTHDFIVINGKQIIAGPRLEDVLPDPAVRVNLITKTEWAKNALSNPLKLK